MAKYLLYAKLEIEVDADDEDAVKELAVKTFEKIEKAAPEAKITEAKLADRATGYFIK